MAQYTQGIEIEKFTSADVFADNENDTIVDEGYFIRDRFFSTLVKEQCECENRSQHCAHLREIFVD